MPEPTLIADIGGTKARFALAHSAPGTPRVTAARTFANDDFVSLAEVARTYLKSVRQHPRRAVLAIASALDSDEVTLTNRNWRFRRDDLARQLNLDALHLVNDFAAVAYALPHLAANDFHVLQRQLSKPLAAPVTLLGAGTGLGVALLIRSPQQGWHVIATEGGHASFAATNEQEWTLLRWLQKRHGIVSNERLLSGAGLAHVDAALRQVEPVAAPAPQPGLRRPEHIVARARAGNDASARAALQALCRIYGRVAGDAALLHGARTVLIGGGLVLHFADFLAHSDFLQTFAAKDRCAQRMQSMAVAIIGHAAPGLLGAAVLAQQRAADGP